MPEQHSFKERVAYVIGKYENMSELARKVGVSEGTVRHWRDGTSEPRRKNLAALALATNTNAQWLSTGLGPMSVDPGKEACAEAPASYGTRRPEVLENNELFKAVIACIERELQEQQRRLSPEKYAEVIMWVYRIGKHEPLEYLAQTAAEGVRLVT